MRRLLRSIGREPFGFCAFAVFLTLVIHHDGAGLWTLPIVLAGWVAAGIADHLWQNFLDREKAA